MESTWTSPQDFPASDGIPLPAILNNNVKIFEGLFYALLSLFGIVFLISLSFCIKSWICAIDKRITIVKIIYALLPWAMLARMIEFITNITSGAENFLVAGIMTQTKAQIFFGSLPGYIFFSSYILLVLFWIILYYRSRDQDVQFLNKLSKIYLLLNLVVYSIYFALLAMLFTLPTNDVAKIVHPIEACYAGGLSIAAAIGFVIYGRRVYARLNYMVVASKTRQQMCRKIGYLTIVCSIVFSLRSIIIFLSIFVLRPDMVVLNLLSKLVFHLVCELGPTLTIIWFINKSRANINGSQQPLLL
jgi:hypothetical protein